MSGSRIEALLASFPKLIHSGSQHTFVETDTVRYVYQPLEDLYMILITTKNSNILQDIDTLHLLARAVSDQCHSLDEHDILMSCFEILEAFDEIVALGYRENVTLSQVRTMLEMDSHEERIHEIIERNKELEAKEELKRRARQLEMQRRDASRRGGFGADGYQGVAKTYDPPTAAPVHALPESQPAAPAAPFKAKGMQLGKKPKGAALMGGLQKTDKRKPAAAPAQTRATPTTPVAPPPRLAQAAGAAPAPNEAQPPVHAQPPAAHTASAPLATGPQSRNFGASLSKKAPAPAPAHAPNPTWDAASERTPAPAPEPAMEPVSEPAWDPTPETAPSASLIDAEAPLETPTAPPATEVPPQEETEGLAAAHQPPTSQFAQLDLLGEEPISAPPGLDEAAWGYDTQAPHDPAQGTAQDPMQETYGALDQPPHDMDAREAHDPYQDPYAAPQETMQQPLDALEAAEPEPAPSVYDSALPADAPAEVLDAAEPQEPEAPFNAAPPLEASAPPTVDETVVPEAQPTDAGDSMRAAAAPLEGLPETPMEPEQPPAHDLLSTTDSPAGPPTPAKTNETLPVSARSPEPVPAAAPQPAAEEGPAAEGEVAPPHFSVELLAKERISFTGNRDGGLDALEIKGDLLLKVVDPALARLTIGVAAPDQFGGAEIQYRTHPHVDKQAWASARRIALRDPKRPFPLNQQVGVLRWRAMTKDESQKPLGITIWLSPTGDGGCEVNVEYELEHTELQLADVVLIVPIPEGVTPEVSDPEEGSFVYDASEHRVVWRLPSVSAQNPSASLELAVPHGAENLDVFFPVSVEFTATQNLSGLQVADVLAADAAQPIAFASHAQLGTDHYLVH